MASLTWLGHASFLLVSDEGKQIYVDPFLNGNPKTPDEREAAVERSTSSRSRTATATTSATRWRSRRRSRRRRSSARSSSRAGSAARARSSADQLPGINKGGTQEIDGIHFTLVNAFHSSSSDDGAYARRGLRLRGPARGRPRDLLRRRHLRLRRHGADPRASTRPTTRCCRSATTSRWARGRRRSRSSCSATRRASPATTEPSRSSPGRPISSAPRPRERRSTSSSRAARSS